MAEFRYEGGGSELVADLEDVYHWHDGVDVVVLSYPEVTVRCPVSHVAVGGFSGFLVVRVLNVFLKFLSCVGVDLGDEWCECSCAGTAVHLPDYVVSEIVQEFVEG